MAFDLSDSKRDESLRILSDARLPNLMPLCHQYQQAQARSLGNLMEEFVTFRSMMPVTLYDQFGRPVYVPSSGKKIGQTVTIRRPYRFTDRP